MVCEVRVADPNMAQRHQSLQWEPRREKAAEFTTEVTENAEKKRRLCDLRDLCGEIVSAVTFSPAAGPGSRGVFPFWGGRAFFLAPRRGARGVWPLWGYLPGECRPPARRSFQVY